MQTLYELNRFNFSSDQNVVLPDTVKQSALSAIKKWQRRDQLSSSTSVVSLDCVVNDEGKLRIFSIDSRPQGFELLCVYRGDIKILSAGHQGGRSREARRSSLNSPYGGGVTFPDHPGAILEELDKFLDDDRDYPYSFQNSYNCYGENWLWERVSFGQHDEIIDYDNGFSLKAINQRRVFVCPPASKRSRLKKDGIRGVRTVSQMIRKLEEHKVMYYQPFIPPMRSPQGYPMIYSLYFEYDNRQNSYVYAGGLSISRKHLNVVLNGEGVVLGIIG